MAERTAEEVFAAGAVLWRSGPVEVALVHRRRYDDWSFPKGKRTGREHILVTAVREVQEETGVRAVLGRRLTSTQYLVEGRSKRVDYWAARPVAAPGFVPNGEVDDVAWLAVPAARERLSYAHDVAVLDVFTAGPPDTAPVVLLRHADALSKSAWSAAGHADDLARPLSPHGVTQAKLLSGILECFPPARLISSAAERCLATVRPYAELTGAQIETEPAFTLQPARAAGTWSPTPAARERLAEAVARAPVIICAHRQNLAWLLEWACDQLHAPMMGGPPLPKGAFWVLQAGGGALLSAERHQLDGWHGG